MVSIIKLKIIKTVLLCELLRVTPWLKIINVTKELCVCGVV
jgi:hypothetical protein